MGYGEQVYVGQANLFQVSLASFLFVLLWQVPSLYVAQMSDVTNTPDTSAMSGPITIPGPTTTSRARTP